MAAVDEKANNLPRQKLTHIVSRQKIHKAIKQINDGFDTTNKLADRMRPGFQIRPIVAPQPGSFELMVVYTVFSDKLTCKRMMANGTVSSAGDLIIVLRNWMCRRPASRVLSGVTYDYTYTSPTARTSDNGTTTISEVITPSYDQAYPGTQGDIIRVMSVPGGVQIPGTADVYEHNNEVVTWLDCNDDARAWAKVAS